jgi:ribosomal protein L24
MRHIKVVLKKGAVIIIEGVNMIKIHCTCMYNFHTSFGNITISQYAPMYNLKQIKNQVRRKEVKSLNLNPVEETIIGLLMI